MRTTDNERLAALRRYVGEHGNARVTRATVDGDVPLGRWVDDVRQRHRRGALPPDLDSALRALPGWTFDPRGDAWRGVLERLRLFADEHGHVAVPQSHRCADGFELGRRVSYARRNRDRLPPEIAAELTYLPGWQWGSGRGRGSWPVAKQRITLRTLDSWLAAGNSLPVPKGAMFGGIAIGSRIAQARRSAKEGTLPTKFAASLIERGIRLNPRRDQWYDTHHALAAELTRVGPAAYASDHTDSAGVAVGRWAVVQRHLYRRGRLRPDQIEALERLPGWTFERRSGTSNLWWANLDRLHDAIVQVGFCTATAPSYRSSTGLPIGAWARRQARKAEQGELSCEQVDALAQIRGWPPR